jgi:excisionase family DNA binding protein
MAHQFLTTSEVAERLRVPAATVRYWRHIGTGPLGFKAGRKVLYDAHDVDAWIASLKATNAVA